MKGQKVMSQWQPKARPARPPAIPPEFRERENDHRNAQMHVQPQAPWQYPQAIPQAIPQVERPFAQPSIAPRKRELPPYPAHLVRFPDGLLPGSSRRRRGMSVWRIFYLGRHPIALLVELWLTLAVIGLVCGWIVLVALAWALWAGAVSVVWLLRAAPAAMRRHP